VLRGQRRESQQCSVGCSISPQLFNIRRRGVNNAVRWVAMAIAGSVCPVGDRVTAAWPLTLPAAGQPFLSLPCGPGDEVQPTDRASQLSLWETTAISLQGRVTATAGGGDVRQNLNACEAGDANCNFSPEIRPIVSVACRPTPETRHHNRPGPHSNTVCTLGEFYRIFRVIVSRWCT